jgi:hypothetical protein
MLCSETMTQLGASSRPIACLTFAGISMLTVPASGGECVIGSSTTYRQAVACCDEASRSVFALIASGGSFT